MAKACLSILLKLDDHADKKTIENSPLALYAARHWIDHAKFGDVSSRIQEFLFRLFDPDKPHFRAWIWLYDIDRRWENHMSTTHPTRPQASSLYYAALCGFSDLVEHLVRTHPSVINAMGGYHVTPLHASLGRGHKITPRLLREDADVDVRDNDGTTPLHRANLTPLHWVSKQCHLEMVHVLVEYGANVDSRDNYNCTPLHWASHQGHPEVVCFLLGHGVDADARDDDNYSPLHWASQRGHLEVVRALTEHGIDKGIDVNARDHSNWTSLHAASQNGHLEVVQALLGHGADVCASDQGGWTSLQWPSYNGDQEIVWVLLKHGADANTRDNNNWTPLHGASQQGHWEVVQILLEHGADANSRDDSNQTPLDLASRAGHLELVKLLAESSANIALLPGSFHPRTEDCLDTPSGEMP
jgi:ankyrin repeat protein